MSACAIFLTREPFKCRLPSWVYPIEVLQPYLGAQDEQHILATSSKQQQQQKQQASGEKVFLWIWCLKTRMLVAQNDRRANARLEKQVLCNFEPSSLFYGQFSVQKWPFSAFFEAVFTMNVIVTHTWHPSSSK